MGTYMVDEMKQLSHAWHAAERVAGCVRSHRGVTVEISVVQCLRRGSPLDPRSRVWLAGGQVVACVSPSGQYRERVAIFSGVVKWRLTREKRNPLRTSVCVGRFAAID